MRILSGMRPTGHLHLGNYLGALRNWVPLQDKAEPVIFLADLHALTEQPNPTELRANVRELAAAYIASGMDPQKCILFAQSAVPAHSELSWIFSSIAPLGWLYRMTQFKDKAGKNKDQALLALLSYPVLMAADILIYKPTHVPVGEDQKQHVELARDLAGAFNRQYGQEYFQLPEFYTNPATARIMSLRDGSKKMSKTDESDYSRINLTDDADTIALKIRKAKTDPEPLPDTLEALAPRPEADNLLSIYAALLNQSKEQALANVAGQSFAQFKQSLTEVAVAHLAPITAKMRALLADPAEIDRLLAIGATRAQAIAGKHLAEIKEIVGLQKGV